MRAAPIVAAFVLGAAVLACTGGGEPEPTATPTPEPSALEIWARSMAALERVQSVHLKRTMYADGRTYLDDVVFPRGGKPSDPNFVPWPPGHPLPGFPGGSYLSDARPPSVTNLRLVGEELAVGEPVWVVAFEGHESGIDTVRFFAAKAWIAQDSYLISRIEDRTTRGEGCCGAPQPGLNAIIEYSDYGIGPSPTPTPEPTATPPPPPPPTFAIEPTAGSCNATVTVTGRGLVPGDRVSAYVWLSFISRRGEVDGGEFDDLRADEQGNIQAQLQLAEHWCASPDVAVQEEMMVAVYGFDTPGYFRLPYTVRPCRSPAPQARQRYCLNER